jgi:membrane-bound lytic murein transglycosylase D
MLSTSGRAPFRLLTLLIPLVLLLSACAPRTAPPVPAEDVQQVPPEVTRQRAIERAQALIVRAREEARIGLIDAAERSWDEAIGLIEPLAAGDAQMADALAAISAERDRLLLAAVRGEEALGPPPDPLESEATEALSGPEPELDPTHVEEVQEAAEDVEPDYPVVVNDRVLAWLEVYRRDGKLGDWFARSIERSGRYEERFREIFAEEGIPRDLIYMAHVESAFKTSAYSRAHARGIFQFIASTGRRYGLRVDWWIDERGDPEKSCRAAANYLRDLYDEFGDWYLALAAYNGGSGRVRRAIRRSGGSHDFWLHARRRLLLRETRNYVPAILAATLISKNPAKFGFGDVKREEPVPYEVVSVPDQADIEVLAKAAQTEPGVLRELNPALRRGQTPPNYPGYPLKVPSGKADGFAEKLAQIPKDKWIVKQLHRVRPGDTLFELARRYGTSVRAIQASNGMGRRTLLSIGQVLEVPRGPGGAGAWAPPTSGGTYRVRRGDTLGRIARWYGVSVFELQRWNDLGRSTRIYPGQRLKVGDSGSAPSARRANVSGATYRVRHGDSAWKIARRYGLSLNALLRANGLGRHSVLRPGQKLVLPGVSSTSSSSASRRSSTATASGGRYVVRRGDNPWTIARRHGVELNDLLQANGLHRGSMLKPGQTLVIPGQGGESAPQAASASSASAPPAEPVSTPSAEKAASGGTYRVRRGDSPWSISQQHDVPLNALLYANGLSRRSVLKPGQELVIPGEDVQRQAEQVHVVRRGESLYRIAQRYGMTVDQLCDINGLSRRTVIHPGDRLTVR